MSLEQRLTRLEQHTTQLEQQAGSAPLDDEVLLAEARRIVASREDFATMSAEDVRFVEALEWARLRGLTFADLAVMAAAEEQQLGAVKL